MTPKQQAMIKALSGCTFLPGSYTKRFVRDMSSLEPETLLTVKQAAYLEKMFYAYRQQHQMLEKIREEYCDGE